MGKHSTGKYAKGSKSKIIIVPIAIFIVITIITTIVLTSFNSKREVEKTLNDTFSNLKELNKERINERLDYNKLISSLDEMILKNQEDVEVEKLLFRDMQWTIENVEVENDTTTLIVEMKNKDFKNILTSWMKKIVVEKENQNQITNEMALKYLQESIEEENIGEKTVIKRITLNKENNTWKIVVNEDLRDLIFPGIDSVISALK